jgi:hypothetical protein
MNTQTLVEQATQSAPVIPVANPANVVKLTVKTGGAKDGAITVSDSMVESYCAKVASGKPTGKSFPAKLGEIEFTPEQREMIRGARAQHRLDTLNGKKEILAIVRHRKVQFIAHRTNKDDSRGAIRYANEAIRPVRDSEIFGANPKAK